MDMSKLRYFCVTAQAGSLTKASELLHISQPALSKAIKLLEDQLGHKLVIPSGRGIAITDYGQKVAAHGWPIIEKLNELRHLDDQQNEKVLRIASFEVFTTYFLGKVIRESFPDMAVEVLELTPGHMEEALAEGSADIGITYLPVPHRKLDVMKVCSVKMGIFGKLNKFKNNSFSELPFVVPTLPVEGSPSKVQGLDGWPEHVLSRNIRYKVMMMETALDLCRHGSCVGYFPEFVVNLHNEQVKSSLKLEQLPFPAKIKSEKQDVYMIKRKSDLESSDFKKVSKALRTIV